MSNYLYLPHGTLLEKDDQIFVEIARDAAHVQEEEQLMELTKQDPLFFVCHKQKLYDDRIVLSYRLPEGFRPLEEWMNTEISFKKQIATTMLTIKKLHGTQFTTYFYPHNIYCNAKGEVKFVHRGIRSVLPPEKEDQSAVVFQLKCLLIAFFTGESFTNLVRNGLANITFADDLVQNIQQAKSLNQLATVLVEDQATEYSLPVDPPVIYGRKGKVDEEQKKRRPTLSVLKSYLERNMISRSLLLISMAIIGVIVGLFVSHILQVKPSTTAIAEEQAQRAQLEADFFVQEQRLTAYQFIVNDQVDEAIATFEQLPKWTEEERETLASLYFEQNTIESLLKAFELGPQFHSNVASALVQLEKGEAKETLERLESNSPSVQIEQAWINEDYDELIDIYLNQLEEDTRAKQLAANAYFSQGELESAYELAAEIKDAPLQVKIKEEEINMIKADKDLDDEEKEEAIEKIEEEMKEI